MKIRLLREHMHGGVAYPAGAEIEVREDQSDRLQEAGTAQRIEAQDTGDNGSRKRGRRPRKEG